MADPIEADVHIQARLLGAVGQAIVAVDPKLRTIYWNDAATRIYGWTSEEALGRPIDELLTPSDGWQQTGNQLLGAIAETGLWSAEFSVVGKDGLTIPISVTDTPVYDDDHELIAWIGVSADLTERRQQEGTLAQLSAIVTSSPDAIISTTLDGVVTSWNAGAEELFGIGREDIVGRTPEAIFPDGRTGEINMILETIGDGRAIRNMETVRRRADGTELIVLVSVAPLRDLSGNIVGASTIARDVTERARLLERLDEERRLMDEAQQSAHLGSFAIDTATGVRSWSTELFQILGLPFDTEPSLEAILERIHPDDLGEYSGLGDASLAGEDVADHPSLGRVIRPDGTVRWVEIHTGQSRDGSSSVYGTLLDVTERKRAADELVHRAHHDPLTDLPNRTLLTERLEAALADQLRTGKPVGVAFFDLDQFKVINDSLGHAAGDRVLQAVAGRLREAAGARDTVGRFGGDEFIVVRPSMSGADLVADFGESLRCSLSAPIVIDGRDFFLSPSVGVTVTRPGDTAEGAIRDADAAMYFAKQRGGNRARVFDDELRLSTQRRLDIAGELRSVLQREQLRVEYQPILSLRTERVVGFEALLRWDHPTRGLIAPDEFIPVAEETGLIVPIGRWVLTEALSQLAEWRADDPAASDLWMSINLSAKQLEQPGIVDAIRIAVSQSGVPPELVHLEITESVLMDDIDHSIPTTRSLRSLGLHISVDDFGTGYSSLGYLKQLPVNTLKIDKSFVSGLGTDLQDRSIAQAVIALADALDLEVLAEGVETTTQAATLIELGCRLGQGFLWSRPLRPDEAIALTRSRRHLAVNV